MEWTQFHQSIVDAAISQWHRPLSAVYAGKQQTSSIDSDYFETDCYTNL